jgi:hypothetical protein
LALRRPPSKIGSDRTGRKRQARLPESNRPSSSLLADPQLPVRGMLG